MPETVWVVEKWLLNIECCGVEGIFASLDGARRFIYEEEHKLLPDSNLRYTLDEIKVEP